MSKRLPNGARETVQHGRILLIPPAPEIDWLKAKPEELEIYGLPPQPPASAGPLAAALWNKLVSKPLELLNSVFPVATTDYRLNRGRLGSGYPGRHESSANWSGGCIAATGGNQFTQIWGSWQVPTPNPPPSSGPGDYRCSTWIGIDGLRRFDFSLPQMGTTQKIVVAPDGTVGAPAVEAWWQWWLRDDPNNGPRIFPNFPVQPGDNVSCVLTVLAPDLVRFFIKNFTQGGKAAHQDVNVPTFHIPGPIGGGSIEFLARGATAEWITERPTKLGSNELYELPDYGTATFTGCLAVSGTAGVGLQPQTLSNARLLKMFKVRDNPHRLVTLSRAKKLDEQTVRTSFSS